ETVWDAVPVLPTASVAVQSLVTVRVQPVPCSDWIAPMATRPELQLSLTEAEPKAAAMSEGVGLFPRGAAGVSVMTGFSVSRVNETVWDVVPVLPAASVALQNFV